MVMGGVRYSTIETEIWYQTTQLLDLPAAAALDHPTRRRHARLARDLVDRGAPGHALRGAGAGDTPWVWRRDLFAGIVTAFVALFVIATPMLTLVVRSLRDRDGWTVAHYRALATTVGRSLPVPVWVAIRNSILVAMQATLIALVLGALVALVVSRRPRAPLARRGLRVLDALFMLPLGVSAVTVGFGFLITLNRPPLDLRQSMILIPIAQAIVALPLVVRSLLPVLRAIDARQREAAATLGAAPGRVLRTVDGPFLVRGLGLGAGFAMATSLGEFGATSFLARLDRPRFRSSSSVSSAGPVRRISVRHLPLRCSLPRSPPS